MTTVTRWNPFKDMEEIQRRLASVLEMGSPRRNALASDEENITVPEWTPAVDILEDKESYLIKVEIPEVQKNDVKVTVESGTLTISGERKVEKDTKDCKYHRVERFYGRFLRSFAVPEDADSTKVTAEFKDGVLRVRLAKSEQARPKQIEVKVD